MAIQTHLYPHNLAFSFPPSQDYLSMDNIHPTNNSFDNLNSNLYNDFVFNLQQHQQHECLLHFQDFHNPSLPYYNVAPTTTTTLTCTTATADHKPPLHLSHGFHAHLHNYSQEMDTYIVSQNEKLKLALREATKKQMGEIWRKIEAKGRMKMVEKKQEIVKAGEKRRELEERITRVEAEKEAWKRMAIEKESMVISLNNRLEQIKEESGYCYLKNKRWLDDAESCCDEDEKEKGIKCRVCKRGEASVVLLPCRHLCCCIHCHACIHACPLCHSLKKASIHALFS